MRTNGKCDNSHAPYHWLKQYSAFRQNPISLNMVLVLIFFHVISMLQKNCVIKEHFIRVMQKGIDRSWLSENFKLLTLPVLEIGSIMFSQNGHL